jgi:tight adherence protein C
MDWLAIVAAFSTGFLLFILLFELVFHRSHALAQRLQLFTRVQGSQTFDDEKLGKPFSERVIKPILVKLADKVTQVIPAKQNVTLEKMLLMAGNPGGFSPGEFLVIEYSLMVILGLIAMFIPLTSGADLFNIILVALGGGIIGYILPALYLRLKASDRQEGIQKALPDVLDLLTVSVEAGLGFDAALTKVIEKTRGVLSEEFNRMLQEVKMGKPRREALKDLGQQLGNDDLQSFVGALIQADQLGISIGNVLRLQSEQMRSKRRQKAEEKAMKAPIKMLIPMVLFIFPTIFIVLMGPAVIQFMETMKQN